MAINVKVGGYYQQANGNRVPIDGVIEPVPPGRVRLFTSSKFPGKKWFDNGTLNPWVPAEFLTLEIPADLVPPGTFGPAAPAPAVALPQIPPTTASTVPPLPTTMPAPSTLTITTTVNLITLRATTVVTKV